jgi:alpha-tubulin suppressor-like RCC1 family protein
MPIDAAWPDAPPGIPTWTAVAAGDHDTCGIRTDGTLWCWGWNQTGQLGNGTVASASRPQQIGTATWRAISTSHDHTCAIQTDGSLWCWGNNATGQLGDGTTGSQLVPEHIGAATDWDVISCGYAGFTCAIATTGALRCWGNDFNGELGDGALAMQQLAPEQIGSATDWMTVGAGYYDACATTTAGALWCWGIQPFATTTTPVAITTGEPVARLGVGAQTECSVGTAGNVDCEGFGETSGNVAPNGAWASVSAGRGFQCATHTDATLWCWGVGSDGQLGNGAMMDATSPVQVGSASWLAVSAGDNHTCGIQTDHTLWCWGDNSEGELGDGTTVGTATPTEIVE